MTRFRAFISAVALVISIGALGVSSTLSKASAQTNAPANTSSQTTNFPADTAIVAKLISNLDTHRSKPGDAVEAETTQDVKQNGQVLLRKGSRVTGQVTDVAAYSKETRQSRITIVLDKITAKSGEQTPLQLGIYALAAAPNIHPDNLQDGRGMAATYDTALASGGLKAEGPGGQLTPKSRGVYGFEGVALAVATGSQHGTTVGSTSHDVTLAKGTQLVLLIQGR